MKIFSIIITVFLLSGCSMFGTKIEDQRPDPVNTTHITQLAYNCPQEPQVDNFVKRDVEWDVASRKELDQKMVELMEELEIPDEDMYIINQVVGDFFFHPGEETRWTISPDGYTNFGRNTSDVIKALKQLKSVARHYKKCIADSKEVVRRANENTEVSQ